jgi:hypothetical protein
MNRLAAIVLTIGFVAVTASPLLGCGHRRGHGCASDCGGPGCGDMGDCCQSQVSYVEQTVTAYRPEWREREVSYTVNRVVPRTVVTQQQCTVMIPVWTSQKQMRTVYTRVPRPIERQVTCCRMVPTCVTDPCTGCTRTVCQPQTFTQTVHSVVMECVPQQQEVTVPVCTMTAQQRTYEVRRVVCETVPEQVTRRVPYCVMVPYQTTVRVPVCTPMAACAPSPCCGS